jgi:methionine synthase II (cobalamin-independent)
MNDWADEIANKIVDFGWDSEELATDIAKALRKAKADGMREAAEYAQTSGLALNAGDQCGAAADYCDELRTLADKIEKP